MNQFDRRMRESAISQAKQGAIACFILILFILYLKCCDNPELSVNIKTEHHEKD